MPGYPTLPEPGFFLPVSVSYQGDYLTKADKIDGLDRLLRGDKGCQVDV